VELATTLLAVEPQGRQALRATLRVGAASATRDGWVVLRADCGELGRPVLAFRVRLGVGSHY
jgi:hypothetical protein